MLTPFFSYQNGVVLVSFKNHSWGSLALIVQPSKKLGGNLLLIFFKLLLFIFVI
jgi:hypothetical protein